MLDAEEVVAVLQPEEPDYEAAQELGLEALPILHELVQTAEPMMASKAAYLAARIGGTESIPVLETATTSPHPEVRVAVVSAAQLLPQGAAEPLLQRLALDADPSVSRYAARTAAARKESTDRG